MHLNKYWTSGGSSDLKEGNIIVNLNLWKRLYSTWNDVHIYLYIYIYFYLSSNSALQIVKRFNAFTGIITNETFPWKHTHTHKLIEKLSKISLYTVTKYEVHPNQIYIKLLYVIYICLGGSLQLLFPMPKKLLNFVGTSPQARPLKNQLWCYTWRHWTVEAPDPPNINKNHRCWKRWAMVPS